VGELGRADAPESSPAKPDGSRGQQNDASGKRDKPHEGRPLGKRGNPKRRTSEFFLALFPDSLG
jgi:hypothetical protein